MPELSFRVETESSWQALEEFMSEPLEMERESEPTFGKRGVETDKCLLEERLFPPLPRTHDKQRGRRKKKKRGAFRHPRR